MGIPKFNNLSLSIGDWEIDDVCTRVGEVIDIVTDNEDGLGERIGSVLDSLTDDINIKL